MPEDGQPRAVAVPAHAPAPVMAAGGSSPALFGGTAGAPIRGEDGRAVKSSAAVTAIGMALTGGTEGEGGH